MGSGGGLRSQGSQSTREAGHQEGRPGSHFGSLRAVPMPCLLPELTTRASSLGQGTEDAEVRTRVHWLQVLFLQLGSSSPYLVRLAWPESGAPCAAGPLATTLCSPWATMHPSTVLRMTWSLRSRARRWGSVRMGLSWSSSSDSRITSLSL